MSISVGQFRTIDLLVPSNGTTHVVPVSMGASSTPQGFDWASFSASNFQFFPQSVKIDNTAGTQPAVLTFPLTGEECVVPAGGIGYFNYAATGNSQPWTLTGAGNVNLFWMDFPCIPSNVLTPGQAASGTDEVVDTTLEGIISGTSDTQTSTGATVYATLFEGGNPISDTNPLFTQPIPKSATLLSGSATASGATTIGTAPSANLRKLSLSIPGNAAQATAGDLSISISVNGVTVFSESVYVPATALDNAGLLYHRDLDFGSIVFAGGGGALVATLGAALSAGSLAVNAWFD